MTFSEPGDHDGMSFFGQRPSSLAPTGLPEGQAIGTFSRYADAQKVVDHLSDQHFDVQAVSIVGHDLRSVERVTGRLSYPRVAMLSAAQGAMFGLFFGVILAMFGGSGWGVSVLLTVLLGAAFWVILGVISFAAQRGRRDFTSVSTFVAARYDVVVRGDLAQSARQAVQGLNLTELQPGGWGAPHQQPQPQQPVQQAGPQSGPVSQGQRQGTGQGTGSSASGSSAAGSSAAGSNASGGTATGHAPWNGGQPASGTHGAPGQAASQQPTRRAPAPGEKDLPDGRPRYGVRVDPQETPGDAGQSRQQS